MRNLECWSKQRWIGHKDLWTHHPRVGPMEGKILTPSYMAENWSILIIVSAVKYIGAYSNWLWHRAGHTQVSSEASVLCKGMKNKFIRFLICAQGRVHIHFQSWKFQTLNRQKSFCICIPKKVFIDRNE